MALPEDGPARRTRSRTARQDSAAGPSKSAVAVLQSGLAHAWAWLTPTKLRPAQLKDEEAEHFQDASDVIEIDVEQEGGPSSKPEAMEEDHLDPEGDGSGPPAAEDLSGSDQSPAGPTDGGAAASSAQQQHPVPEAPQRQPTPDALQQEGWFRPVTGRLLATAGAAAKLLSLNRPGSALHALAELAAERDPVALEAATAAAWAGSDNSGGEAHDHQLPDGHWDELEACARPLPGGGRSGWEKLRLAEPGGGGTVTTVARDLHRFVCDREHRGEYHGIPEPDAVGRSYAQFLDDHPEAREEEVHPRKAWAAAGPVQRRRYGTGVNRTGVTMQKKRQREMREAQERTEAAKAQRSQQAQQAQARQLQDRVQGLLTMQQQPQGASPGSLRSPGGAQAGYSPVSLYGSRGGLESLAGPGGSRLGQGTSGGSPASLYGTHSGLGPSSSRLGQEGASPGLPPRLGSSPTPGTALPGFGRPVPSLRGAFASAQGPAAGVAGYSSSVTGLGPAPQAASRGGSVNDLGLGHSIPQPQRQSSSRLAQTSAPNSVMPPPPLASLHSELPPSASPPPPPQQPSASPNFSHSPGFQPARMGPRPGGALPSRLANRTGPEGMGPVGLPVHSFSNLDGSLGRRALVSGPLGPLPPLGTLSPMGATPKRARVNLPRTVDTLRANLKTKLPPPITSSPRSQPALVWKQIAVKRKAPKPDEEEDETDVIWTGTSSARSTGPGTAAQAGAAQVGPTDQAGGPALAAAAAAPGDSSQEPAAKRHKAQASVVDITGDAAEEDTAMDIDADAGAGTSGATGAGGPSRSASSSDLEARYQIGNGHPRMLEKATQRLASMFDMQQVDTAMEEQVYVFSAVENVPMAAGRVCAVPNISAQKGTPAKEAAALVAEGLAQWNSPPLSSFC